MSIWSQLTEAVATLGGSISGFLNSLARATTSPEKTLAFTVGVVALGAKMAKADGIVTTDEVSAFTRVFSVPERELAGLARLFNFAKQDTAGYETYARQIARLFAGGHRILEDVLDCLFYIAKADGAVHEREVRYLERVASIFGFDHQEFRRIKARHVVPEAADAYAILGVDPDASAQDIKRQYRVLVRENHPDLHVAEGMPKELIDLANERLQRINAAYDEIARERGI